MLVACVPALAEAVDATGQCAFKTDSGKTEPLTDGDIMTAWEPKGENAELKIKLPENGAGYICIDWLELPKEFTLLQYNSERDQIGSIKSDSTYSGLRHTFRIDGDACYLALNLKDKGQKVSEISVYTVGSLPADVQNWTAPVSKADMLVVAARPGDEFSCFGGVIPYNTLVENRRVQVVFMTGTDRQLIQKSLDALWASGVIAYPDFLGLEDKNPETVKKAVSQWGGKDKFMNAMAALVRLYQPEIIVTHSENGENNDALRAATAQALKMAAEASWDEQQYPKSAEKYGAWQVKKLYTHLGSEDIAILDWSQSYDELDGLTPVEFARNAYETYQMSVEKPFQGDDGTFRLSYTHVGPDAQHNDLFENVLMQAQPTQAPVIPEMGNVQPAATPAIMFSPEPTMEPTPEPGSADGFGNATRKTAMLVIGGIAVMLAVSGIQVLMYILRRRNWRRWFD